MKKYKRITYRDRLKIEALYNVSKMKSSHIARELGFTAAALSYELKRGMYKTLDYEYREIEKYSADRAQQAADFNRTTKGAQLKIGNDHAFVKTFEELILGRKLSPAAALAVVKRENIKLRTRVCLRTLYKYIDEGIFPNITNRALPYRGIRKRKHKKVREIKKPPRGTSIEERPPEVASRQEFGHWELDSVIGTKEKGQTLLVLTERKTRFELIFRSQNKAAASTVSMLNGLERRLGSAAFKKIFRSITCDNGTEFSDTYHMELSARGNSRRTTVYYCHPYCSSERGSNENQNRIIRRFIKKGTPISQYSNSAIQKTQDYLNDLPRALFDWQTARDLFLSELSRFNLKICDFF